MTTAHWERTRLGDVADITSGFGFPTNSQGDSSGEIPFAKVGDISKALARGSWSLDSADNYVSRQVLESLGARTVPAGSTVFAKIGEAIRLKRRALTTVELAVDNNVMAATPHDCVDSRFLFHWFRTVDLYSIANATTVPSVRKSEVVALSFFLPPLDEQRRIVIAIDTASNAIRSARRALTRAQTLIEKFRQSVLAAAFRGELNTFMRVKSRDLVDAIDSKVHGVSPSHRSPTFRRVDETVQRRLR